MSNRVGSTEADYRYAMAEIESDPRFLDATWLSQRWTPRFLAAKRAIDILFSLPLLLVALVSFPFIYIAIKLDSRGPALYRQERVGKDGKSFFVLKYRSMYTNAEQDGAKFTSKNDDRITRVGTFLRKTRLDEVPQVINVLRGEMALVGPRPERPHVIEEMTRRLPQFGMRTLVQPGLTGWAQVKGSYAANETELAEKLEYDLYYIRNVSLKRDLSVLLETVRVVLGRKGV